ncbi:hypothetical protein [Paenibacillus qinlingensis]|uniref:hypothetical protein n=1 Tax=Paenibacillus qinlingensis TaxID=1837343 RepID=UPI001563BEEF|nr:hypothetical protein [Paenibacillus qinlingensis]NQX57523.1 hypothetical protein [Paenibacillus qinlingensis]
MTRLFGDDRGTAGDMFGAINSLFTGLAFAGIIFTIIIQRQELSLQREELKLQREVVARSTAELAGQREMMNLQRFETTFFNLITAHKTIVSSVTSGKLTGIDLFETYYSDLSNDISRHPNGINSTQFEMISNPYLSIMKNLMLCYDNFIFILQFVRDELKLNDEQKYSYSNIFVAQLPKSQIGMF